MHGIHLQGFSRHIQAASLLAKKKKQHPYSIPDLCAKDSISSTAPGVVFVQTVRFHATPYPRWVPGQGSAFLILFWDAQ